MIKYAVRSTWRSKSENDGKKKLSLFRRRRFVRFLSFLSLLNSLLPVCLSLSSPLLTGKERAPLLRVAVRSSRFTQRSPPPLKIAEVPPLVLSSALAAESCACYSSLSSSSLACVHLFPR
jgi:hypothetical protein